MTIKLNVVGRRRPDTTLAEHRHYIRHVHGERVLAYIRLDPDAAPRRYVQNTVMDSTYRSGLPADDPLTLNRDFVTQLWLPDLQALHRSRQTAFYQTHLRDDEDRFVDQANVVFLPCSERLIQAGPALPGSWKLFILMRCVPGASLAAFDTAWWGLAQQCASSAVRHVQNLVMAVASVSSPANGIDEFWFAEEGEARAHLVAWRARLDEVLVEAGLVHPFSFVSLIAREDVVHAGTA